MEILIHECIEQGFRMVCAAQLPLDAHTLVSGSRDGGRTVVAAPPAVSTALLGVAERLRLRPHLCRGVTVYAAAGKKLHYTHG